MLTVPAERRSRAAQRLAPLGLAALLLLGSAAAPADAAAPTSATTNGYQLDLGKRSDFVAQTNFVQCVGASMQMMLNMIQPGTDRSAATQLKLQKLARAWSGQRPDGIERQGASVRGWAAGLSLLGAGPYTLVGTVTLDEAVLAAAQAMRRTGKPVGLLMWRGRHAWVMSGFRATGDPLVPGSRVTSVLVEDPLYPHGSSVWGPSPAPGSALSVEDLGRQFVPRRTSSRWGMTNLSGMYVLVVPYEFDLQTLRRI